MIGLVYLGVMVGGTIFFGLKAAKENFDAINRGKQQYKDGKNRIKVYTDRKGATRSLTTGKRVTIDNLTCSESSGKDCYMYDEKGNPIRNLSEEIREERYHEAKVANDPKRTVVEWKQGINPGLAGYKDNPLYAGTQYKDLNNGKIYVCRHFKFPKEIASSGGGTFYMDVKTGLLVRETDSEKIDRERGYNSKSSEIYDKFITWFNDKQRKEGYMCQSNIPLSTDINGEESKTSYIQRMKWFYCNKYIGYDRLSDMRR